MSILNRFFIKLNINFLRPFMVSVCVANVSNHNNIFCINYITNERGFQVGDSIANYCLAKILSLKYPDKLKFLYTPFIHSDLFIFDSHETKIELSMQFSQNMGAYNDENILQNLDKNNTLFIANLETKIEEVDSNLFEIIKKEVQLKQTPELNPLPSDMITIAVHIRKGNGGGQFYDGEQSSLQIYDYDRNQICYIDDYVNYPFDWESYKRNGSKIEHVSLANEIFEITETGKFLDQVSHWQTKFPPEQYYVDQIVKLSKELSHKNLYIQIFTDDKDPVSLIERIKLTVDLPNVSFYFVNNRNLSFRDQIAQDLYSMSRSDILIRSQSYFSRVAELMGNHKIVIYPLEYKWEGNKLIMNKIVVKGDLSILKNNE